MVTSRARGGKIEEARNDNYIQNKHVFKGSCVLESKCSSVPVIQGDDILQWSECAGVSLSKGLRNEVR